MFLSSSDETRSKKKFIKKFESYYDASRDQFIQIDTSHRHARSAPPAQRVPMPQNDITFIFNNEAMLAISHAIEDLAGEERQGDFFATFQKIENFLYQKKRYNSLAQDLDSVRVWADGNPPKGCPKIDFVPLLHPELERYWVVCFSSPKTHAVLVCRQVNHATEFAKKYFLGFYSFNPFLVESIRRNFNLMSCGLDGLVHLWEKQNHIPNFNLQQLEHLFEHDAPPPPFESPSQPARKKTKTASR